MTTDLNEIENILEEEAAFERAVTICNVCREEVPVLEITDEGDCKRCRLYAIRLRKKNDEVTDEDIRFEIQEGVRWTE